MEQIKLKMDTTMERLKLMWAIPTTWNRACELVVTELSASGAWHLDYLPTSQLVTMYEKGKWDALARASMNSLHAEGVTPNMIVEVLCGKQSDYGSDNINRFGIPGLAVRLWDKIARWTNLNLYGVEPANESLRDTKMDIVGYVTIALMYELGWFNLPLVSE